jgi:hypothetical protein
VVTAHWIEHPAADVLRILAMSKSSGALEIRSSPGGTIFLRDGKVTYAEASGVPPMTETDGADPNLWLRIHSTMVEAGLTLLTASIPDGERPLFRPGRQHWTGLTCHLGVELFLAEVAQRTEGLAKLGLQPDDEVRLRGLSPGTLAVLTKRQWLLVSRMSGPQTARSLARSCAAPLGTTLADVASLVGAGMAEKLGGTARLPPKLPALDFAVPAPAPPVPRPEHRAVPRPEPRVASPMVSEPADRPREQEPQLPRRVRGATPIHPGTSEAVPRASPAHDTSTRDTSAREVSRREVSSGEVKDVSADTRYDVALRLLEGLRRL